MAGFLEKNIAAAADALERALASERWARRHGLLQRIDPRFKAPALLLVVLACSITSSMPVLVTLYVAAVALAMFSGIGLADYTRRVWIFIPLFSGLIAVPALFLTPGGELFSIGPFVVTREGVHTALLLVLRVSTSVAFTVLFILTTSWNNALEALRCLRVPAFIVSLLAMCYRYLLLLVRTLSELLIARRSRVLGSLRHRQELTFLARSAGFLFLRALQLAEGVQMAMLSRGYAFVRRVDSNMQPGGRPPGDRPSSGSEEADGEGITTAARRGRQTGGQQDPARGTEPSGYPQRDKIFELLNVRFTYPDGVHGVHIARLEIEAGSCTVLLGPNGCGKSTLLKILDGLLFPQAGTVRAFGEPVTEKRFEDEGFRRRFRSRIGLVFQDADIQCFSPTVAEELAFGPTQLGLGGDEITERVREAMRTLGLESIAGRYPYRLSGGEKKRVAIASVLTVGPDIFLLDEPTANLDPATEGILIDLLAGLAHRGTSIVIATQDLLLARHIADRAVILGPGKELIAKGTAEMILDDEELLGRADLMHAHHAAHRKAAAGKEHSHYTEEESR